MVAQRKKRVSGMNEWSREVKGNEEWRRVTEMGNHVAFIFQFVNVVYYVD